MKKINFKIDLKKLGLVVLSSIVTAIILSIYIISLPKTELISDVVSFDLSVNNEFTTKRYVLTLETDTSVSQNNALNQTRDVISTRLKKAGVSDFHIKIDKEKNEIEVVVISNKDVNELDQYITQRYYLEFVTRKDGVDFENKEDFFVLYNKENYNTTGYTREKFRNIHITQLKTTTGDLSYFAIYKPWEHELKNFDNFFNPLAGSTAGIMIDDFVYPITIPVSSITDQYGNIQRQPFAIGIGAEKKVADTQNILFNSGIIPVKYSTTTNEIINKRVVDLNIFIILSVPLFIILSLFVLNKLFIKDNLGIASFIILSTLPISILVMYMKLSNTPISHIEIFLIAMIAIIINYLLTIFTRYRFIFSSILFVTFVIVWLTSYGLISQISMILGIILVVNYILHILIPYYFRLLKIAVK